MRIAAFIGIVPLLLWHLWCGLHSLYTGSWFLAVGLEFYHPPFPYSVSDEVNVALAAQYDGLQGLIWLFDGVCRTAAGLFVGLSGALIAKGSRRRRVGASMLVSVVLHGLTTVPAVGLALLFMHQNDYIFYVSDRAIYLYQESLVTARLPLELSGIAASFVVCSLVALVITILGKTTSPIP